MNEEMKKVLDRHGDVFIKQLEAAQRAAKKRTYKDAWYPSPIKLAPARCGNVSITHRIVTGDTPVVGARQAFSRGINRAMAVLKEPLIVHELRDKKRGVWMTDLPEELNQIYEMIHDVKPHGDVLVGGLGLGILPEILYQLDDVDSIAVVEIDKRVIKLTGHRGMAQYYDIVHDDIVHYMQTCAPVHYDCILLDTWQMTNETSWWSDVLPQRRAVRQRWGKRPTLHCWGEDIMRTSVEAALQMGKGHWFYKGLPAMTARQAHAFCEDAGMPAWEKKYGAIVDANYRKER